MHLNQRGFTLVELSIVLVILGLLVGGVLTGQSLIRAAELRSITTQEQRYIAAIQTFRDKYFAIPGDMTNATSYWGIAAGTGSDATCLAQASTTAATCNGNGDAKILVSTGSQEYFRFWQHLANAGLIEGSYTGYQSGASATSASNVNVPVGRITSSLWYAYNYGTASAQTLLFDGQYDNILAIGALTSNALPTGIFLKPEEAYNIDTKLDDGKPATGKVASVATMTNTSTSCTNGTDSTNIGATYLLTNTALSCALIFRQAY